MQIACKRFGCQKAVEVCYWTCKHRKNCKDWTGALDGQPGLIAITERLEMAAAKSGRVFDAKSLIKPQRVKRAVAARQSLASVVNIEAKTAPLAMAHAVAKTISQPVAKAVSDLSKSAPQAVTKPVTNGTRRKQRTPKLTIKRTKPERKVMPKLEDEKTEPTTEAATPKVNGTKPAVKPAKPKPPTNGTVYLLLSKNGKYKELREADLMKEAAHIFKDPSLRLVKGQHLVPQITFKSLDE